MTDGGPLFDQGTQALSALLGPDWQVRPSQAQLAGADAILEIEPPDQNFSAQLLVDTKPSLAPRQVRDVVLPKWALVQQVNRAMSMLVVAPWISPRTRDMLREHGVGYLDLTGNVDLRIARPAIVIHTEGADKEPLAVTRDSKPTLAGPRAGSLVRLLVDYAPPYRSVQLAREVRVSLSWISRLVGLLEDQLLVRREGRAITYVDWRNLLRARAETYDLLRHNPHAGMLAPNGIRQVEDQLRARRAAGPQVAVTGHYAARTVAPLTSGGQLLLYVEAKRTVVREQLGLLPVDSNADVLLMRAHDPVVFERTRKVDGITQVALSQVALDCLAGPGRLPAEGEAVLEYMAGNEAAWREKSLPATTNW